MAAFKIGELGPMPYFVIMLALVFITFWSSPNFQIHPFLSDLVFFRENSVFPATLVLSILSFASGAFFINETAGVFKRLLYALSFPLAFLACYEFVWGDAFNFLPADLGREFASQAFLYGSALLAVIAGTFALAHYIRLNTYLVLLGLGFTNLLVVWFSRGDPGFGPLAGWYMPIFPLLLLGFSTSKFWRYSFTSLLLFVSDIILFAIWIATGQLEPVTTISWLLNVFTKSIMALFFVSLLLPQQSQGKPSSPVAVTSQSNKTMIPKANAAECKKRDGGIFTAEVNFFLDAARGDSLLLLFPRGDDEHVRAQSCKRSNHS